MANNVHYKCEQEKKMLTYMISLYCRKQHSTKETLCADCAELDAYAKERSEKCPFMETKTFCSNCEIHCYNSEMREKIRKVMRFSGPRIIYRHPIAAISHVIETKREKKKMRNSHEGKDV